MSVRIQYEDIRKGDRLRVTYVEGRTRCGTKDPSVIRSVASTAAQQAMGKVWLTPDADILVKKSWPNLEIYRL